MGWFDDDKGWNLVSSLSVFVRDSHVSIVNERSHPFLSDAASSSSNSLLDDDKWSQV
jgi:hypothetical protein